MDCATSKEAVEGLYHDLAQGPSHWVHSLPHQKWEGGRTELLPGCCCHRLCVGLSSGVGRGRGASDLRSCLGTVLDRQCLPGRGGVCICWEQTALVLRSGFPCKLSLWFALPVVSLQICVQWRSCWCLISSTKVWRLQQQQMQTMSSKIQVVVAVKLRNAKDKSYLPPFWDWKPRRAKNNGKRETGVLKGTIIGVLTWGLGWGTWCDTVLLSNHQPWGLLLGSRAALVFQKHADWWRNPNPIAVEHLQCGMNTYDADRNLLSLQ